MKSPRDSPDGFALVACIFMMVLLMILALGLTGLSTIELRKTGRDQYVAAARANARLALLSAIGQLQKNAGPDQRVTATSEMLDQPSSGQKHWTGVWRATRKDGTPYLVRDDLNGGLRDTRLEGGTSRSDQAMEWLVSGEKLPGDSSIENPVTMVGGGTTGDKVKKAVEVPKVAVNPGSGSIPGHMAWWTGDLGVRANISTSDPRSDRKADVSSPTDGGLYRVMASQAADLAIMSDATTLEKGEEDRLVSGGTAGLTHLGADWVKGHAFDYTVQSSGVLSDVVGGGLKRDLTAYLESQGTAEPSGNGVSLSDDDSLVGVEADQLKTTVSTRHAMAGPRFGLLRDWAQSAVVLQNPDVEAKVPDLDGSQAGASRTLALSNENAVKLAGNHHAALGPVLVEAVNYQQMANYVDRTQVMGGTTAPSKIFQFRTFMYPRVTLWNPYNFELRSDRMMVMIQGNGRAELWTRNVDVNKSPQFRDTTAWLMFEGGRDMNFDGGSRSSTGYNDPYMGSYYFVVPSTTFKPGECLVFSPSKTAEYDGRSVYRPGPYNLNSNELSCTVPPDPARSYYISGSDIDGGVPYQMVQFWYSPGDWFSGVTNQADDTRVIAKRVPSASQTVSFEDFDALPQLSVLSASLQYGAGREPRIAWSTYNKMPMQLVDKANPKPTIVPDVRTREGIRLRWFREHKSNIAGSGPLSNTSHFEEALLANWNPRASYVMRSPWENLAGTLPSSGTNPASGPWFFGAYTRDLYDQAVTWGDQQPVQRNGRYHGNPFGTPQEGMERMVMFDLPHKETGILSLAQFQHAKISELIWHPSFVIGNSLADPRLGLGNDRGLNRTAAVGNPSVSANVGGFQETELGWSSDSQRSQSKGIWASNARAMLNGVPNTDNMVYDISFEANRTLFDRYFLSTGSATEKAAFLKDPEDAPLPNARMRLAPATQQTATADALDDFRKAAYHLMVDGAFNVNSTSVEAWKALLSSSRRASFSQSGDAAFPHMLNPPGGEWKSGSSADSDAAWSGYRSLTEGQIDALARAIVEEVKLRGPFMSMADFVNRRLAEDSTGRMGPLQAAIERAGLNQDFVNTYPLDNSKSLPDYKHPDNIRDATALEQTLKPASKAWGASSYLTQADVLQVIGPVLSARSDSFVVRAYGDAVDEHGRLQARSWCEAVVQRTPEPLAPDASGMDCANPNQPGDFGRRFVITAFRWLDPEEI